MSESPPRPWSRLILGGSALVLVPAVLALAVMGAKFRGLGVNQAMEHAQIARHVAAGDGLATDSVRPISLAVRPSVKNHPDLYHAPLHPLLLGMVFAATHATDRASAAFGLLLWVVSVVLTFVVARRWFGTTAGALAAAFAAGNVALLKAALLGLPYPLAAVLLLLAAAFVLPGPRPATDPPGEGPSDVRVVLAGLLSALVAMTHYLFFFAAPAAALHLVVSRRRRGRAALLFALGFVAVLVPWMIRNAAWARWPFFSLYWYEALAGTDTYPGDSVWRSMAAASSGPWEFAFIHPLQMMRKVAAGWIRFWNESLGLVDPVVAFLFVGALLSRRERGPWHGWFSALAGGLLLAVGASCVFRAEPELLLCWAPLLAIPAAGQAVGWLRERVGTVSLRRYWSVRLIPSLFRDPDAFRVLMHRAAVVAVLVVAMFPLGYYLWVYRAEPAATPLDPQAFADLVPADATVLTDQPAMVAWKGGRRAVWLPQEEKDWDLLESRGGRIDATYVTPNVSVLMPASRAGWWWWIASPRGVYRDLAPVDGGRLPGVLRLRGRG